jgi:hypothetical protein
MGIVSQRNSHSIRILLLLLKVWYTSVVREMIYGKWLAVFQRGKNISKNERYFTVITFDCGIFPASRARSKKEGKENDRQRIY